MEPESLAAAVTAVIDERKVEYWPAEPGPLPSPASLILTGPEDTVASLYDFLDRKARAIHAQGATEGNAGPASVRPGRRRDHRRRARPHHHYRHGPPTKQETGMQPATSPVRNRARRDRSCYRNRRTSPSCTSWSPKPPSTATSNEPAMLVTSKGMTPIPIQAARDLIHRPDSQAADVGGRPQDRLRDRPARRLHPQPPPARPHRPPATGTSPATRPRGTRVCELDHVIPYNHHAAQDRRPDRRQRTSPRWVRPTTRPRPTGSTASTATPTMSLTFTDIAGGTHESAPYCYLDPNPTAPPDPQPPDDDPPF